MRLTIEPYADAPAAYHEYAPDASVVARLVADAITAAKPGLAVEHVGSTAVPGCAGKGVIDLMILYPAGQLAQAKGALDQLGFQRQTTREPFPEDRPMRVGVVARGGKRYRIHAHVIAANAAEASELRAFRDRLRAESDFRSAYQACKQDILAAGVTDSVAYAEAKGQFISQANSTS